jgi:hypothetical protein
LGLLPDLYEYYNSGSLEQREILFDTNQKGYAGTYNINLDHIMGRVHELNWDRLTVPKVMYFYRPFRRISKVNWVSNVDD